MPTTDAGAGIGRVPLGKAQRDGESGRTPRVRLQDPIDALSHILEIDAKRGTGATAICVRMLVANRGLRLSQAELLKQANVKAPMLLRRELRRCGVRTLQSLVSAVRVLVLLRDGSGGRTLESIALEDGVVPKE